LDIRERNGPAERDRLNSTRNATDVLVGGRDVRAARWHGVAVEHEADQLLRNAAVPSMQNADDDFLSDVAAFVHADRARLNAGFERDRLLVHVSVKARNSSFDSQHLGRVVIGFRHAARGQQLSNGCGVRLLDVEVEARLTSITDASDDG